MGRLYPCGDGDHRPDVWVWEGYNDGHNRMCQCGRYLFKVDYGGTVLSSRYTGGPGGAFLEFAGNGLLSTAHAFGSESGGAP